MSTRSAGILLFRRTGPTPEILLAHLGGPFWARKDDGAWSIPKGECEAGEDDLTTANREFTEELGVPVPAGELLPLGEAKASRKIIVAWAVEADLDPADVTPGTFEMEWPPRSGRTQSFPEIDRVAWFDLTMARTKLVKGQHPFLDRVAALVS